jgi:uncharacterized repeat protein (TIGR01451 family)
MLRIALIALSLAFFAAPAAGAAGLSATQSVERQEIVKAADGSETITWVDAGKAAPGDVLRYSMRFENSGAAADNVVLAVPVPAEVTYIENTASVNGAEVHFSADGGVTFAPRSALMVAVNGQARPALASEITHVRWSFAEGIAAGASGELSFNAFLK